MIPQARPFLPPKAEYDAMIDRIWANHWLTNHGPIAGEFEKKLGEYLDVRNLQFVTNGTIALQLAYKALSLSGEVITTPFTFIATASSIQWEGLKVVFADIDEHTFNIDVNAIEPLINEKTSAIVATHVYGNPCKISELENLAQKHHLKLIFDAAHCFGVRYKGRSVLECGDVSMLSLHATKLFHSTEGGILVTKNGELSKKIWSLKNFGFEGEEVINDLGINGKNSEFHAAMGLCNLKYADYILGRYKENFETYKSHLEGNRSLSFQQINSDALYNHAYFPALFDSESKAVKVKNALKEEGIISRRYFYPALSNIGYLRDKKCKIAESIAPRILCLPMSSYLEKKEIAQISAIVNANSN